MKKQEKGVTLLALVITIIVLIIIASIGISSGKGTIKSAKFSKFQAELKIIQNKANEWNQAYENGETINIGTDPTSEQKMALDSQEVSEIITNKAGSDTTKIEEIKSSFRMLTNDYIKGDLGIDSIEGEYLVNIKERMVVSTEAFQYEGINYYMIDQMEDELYNVEYKNQNDTGGDFTVNATQTGEEEWKIKITDIQHEKYVSKWQVKYKKEGTTYWQTADKLEFTVPEGTYQIELVHGNEISLGTKKVKASNCVDLPETGGTAFSRAVGTIDVAFLTGTSYAVGTANKPTIDETNMIPVNWDETDKCWRVTDEADWVYSYGDTDETKKWANVMLRDVLKVEGITDAKTATVAEMKGKKVTTEGSMLVWIPRYAYKITYYAESDTDRTGNPVGYSDARGIVDKDGKTPTGMNSPVTSIGVTVGSDNYYRPHPAFESSKTYTQGEWSSKLTGIWMGKFETTKRETDTKITILPNTASYTNQTIGTFYTDAQNLGIANSHMAKNSEWGAMAYLTESKYGRNGTAVTKNEAKVNNIITTGQGAYISNINQSTTNNVYGIYDTVGGAYEYTAGYVADNSQNYGNSFASTTPSDSTSKNNKETSTQYATVYTKTASDSYTENYTANINKVFGDAIIETSTAGTETTSWHSASSYFVGLDSGDYFPFFKRGGGFSSSGAGSFYFNSSGGGSNSYYGFRVCLAVR